VRGEGESIFRRVHSWTKLQLSFRRRTSNLAISHSELFLPQEMANSTRPAFHQDYIARIRYSNALPPPPCPPKLLDIPNTGLSSGQYTSASFASRLAREQPLNIEADAELGMPIDLVGIPGVFDGDESGRAAFMPLKERTAKPSSSDPSNGEASPVTPRRSRFDAPAQCPRQACNRRLGYLVLAPDRVYHFTYNGRFAV
jgi:hypothetical protein